ncbi:JNK1/MAPK8-associated membrane protein-like isoform X1 [Watersipora subatra]|uniref:JNK1/MAPK8-associated membrane protein-like isoform X1 n=1 Tax=Watersipora subatra TaxID=2589382 RepID=UPI00355B62FE
MMKLCPGSYCGVGDASVTDIRNCSACLWGYRPTKYSICEKCVNAMPVYDWMYLGFMLLISFVLHSIAIDVQTNRKSRRMLWMYLSAVLETVAAAVCSLLLVRPVGSLELQSCTVESIQDWYPVFFNPLIFYTTRLNCTQEMVYPLYTIVMIFYALQVPAMLLLRPIFSHRLLSKQGVDTCGPIYSALYFLPIMVLVHSIAAGILYYCYPYVTLLISGISLAIHVSQYDEENALELLLKSLYDGRSFAILTLHWLLHAFGILALIDIGSNVVLTGCLMLLVPVPYLLYILTAKHTCPRRIDAVLALTS